MINKGIGLCQLCLGLLYGCEDDHHAFVAFVVLTMRCYVAHFSVQFRLKLLLFCSCPCGGVYSFLFHLHFCVFVCDLFLLFPVHTYMQTDLA